MSSYEPDAAAVDTVSVLFDLLDHPDDDYEMGLAPLLIAGIEVTAIVAKSTTEHGIRLDPLAIVVTNDLMEHIKSTEPDLVTKEEPA